MKIGGGEARGRKLFVPKDRRVRPTSDRVRMAVFNILGPVDGFHVLDLFAGTGALGLEALSRGAAQALFVDRHPASCELVRRNVELLNVGERARIRKDDAFRALRWAASENESFDLVFIDPPYGEIEPAALLDEGRWLPILRPGARIVFETSRREERILDGGALLVEDRREYGDTAVTFLKLR